MELFYIEKERESIGEKEDLGRFSKAGGRILREFDGESVLDKSTK